MKKDTWDYKSIHNRRYILLAWKGRSEKDSKLGKCQFERQNVNFQFTQKKGKTTSKSKEE